LLPAPGKGATPASENKGAWFGLAPAKKWF